MNSSSAASSSHTSSPAIPSSSGSSQVAGHFEVTPADQAAFRDHLRAFVPPRVFDAHAHLYDCSHGQASPVIAAGAKRAEFDIYFEHTARWMGDRAPKAGLFFAMPFKGVDMSAANGLVAASVLPTPAATVKDTTSAGLLLIHPNDDPQAIEAELDRHPWSGFKVYHLYANRPDTMNASNDEFLPDWAWELAHARGLVIMLHIVRSRALADTSNQQYLRDHCQRYPNARLVLAHAARGFCGHHTVEAMDSLNGLDNVWFDTSAVCEPEAILALLQRWGVSRCLYGGDFPITQFRGKAISIGDGFYWLDPINSDWKSATDSPRLIGHESLLALRDACKLARCTDADIEHIFWDNARQLLGLQPDPAPGQGKGEALYQEARKFIPGGVQLLSKRPEMFAPTKWPAYGHEAHGVEVIDIDGRRYLDMSQCGIGSCLLGYNHPHVTDAVVRRVQLGSMSTLNSPDEPALARRLLALHPWASQARFARTGGESMAVAVRIVRAATGKDLVAICGYHGWSDWYLAANLGEGGALDGHLLPGLSPTGVPRPLAGTALTFRYNNLEELQTLFEKHGNRLAAVVMEPTRSVDPAPGFLQGVRDLCTQHRTALVLDEITTGFRLHKAGVHTQYQLTPDLVVYAKALGNGHPIGAILGNGETMNAAQSSFISSTYWTEGVGYAAALAVLDVLDSHDVAGHVANIGRSFKQRMTDLAKKTGVPLVISGHPALTYLRFDHPQADALMTLYTTRMLEAHILAGGGFYPTLAHEERHLDRHEKAATPIFQEIADAMAKDNAADRLGGSAMVRQTGFARLT